MGRTTSFRVRLSRAIGLLVLSVGAALTLASWLLAERSARAHTADLFREVSRRAVLRTRAQLDGALPAADSVVDLMKADPAMPADSDRLARTLLAILDANPGFTWVSWSDETGSFTGAYRAGGERRINRSRLVGGTTQLVEQTVAADGSWVPRQHQSGHGYDPRQRPFYLQAKALGRRTWTRPYVFFDQAIPGVTCATPLFAKDGKLTGVVTVDFDLNGLSDFVAKAERDLSPNAEMFVFTVDGTLIAHPSLKLVEQAGQGEEGRLVTASDVADPLVRGYFAHALEQHVQFEHPDDAGEIDESFTFDLGGRSWLASYDSFVIDPGQRWVVAAMAPANDFLAGARRAGIVSILISLALLVAAIPVALTLSARIARPLEELRGRMLALGKLELDDDRPLPHADEVAEIAEMDATLTDMRHGLSNFARYVPRDLVRALLETGKEAKLGGELKQITLLFSDVAGFTTLSESMPPDELVALFGRYLDEMTHEIAALGGTVDKFIGDGIMAFWGAPVSEPRHAALAVEAAIGCQTRLAALAAKDPAIGRLGTRIGVATGNALVGNVGTPERMNYTAMGDVVNLASRLEGLNKVYGTPILVDDDTQAAAKDRVLFRPIDVVAVKGRHAGVKVHQPLAALADATEQLRLLARLCNDALVFHLARDFRAAAARWEEALALAPGDRASTVMLERARKFASAPPAPDWNGIFVAEAK